ncbi:MAG: hypothetical protein PHN69_01795 [Candidatus Pacebacteria bacterium]|nr:hypothetical protein [Candidatus Paceibacterota bacterium]
MFLIITVFIASCILLYFSGEMVVSNLVRLSKYLGVKEFIIAFFVMAFASSLPNIILGIKSAIDGVPELSLGDIFGNNLVTLTLALSLGVLISKNKEIPIESRTIKSTLKFAVVSTLLPLLLLIDGTLSRVDGVLMILFFVFYVFWIFSKKERFTKVYTGETYVGDQYVKEFGNTLKSLVFIILGIGLIFIAAQGIVFSAKFFAIASGISIIVIGLLITGLGNALPEIYFSITSARKDEKFIILGSLMGSVIFTTSLVLGIVCFIEPIKLLNTKIFFINRIFILITILLFYLFSKTSNKIVKREAYVLFLLYFLFILSVFIFK